MTRALILGATALTLSAAVASAQAGYVTTGSNDVALIGGPPYVGPPVVYVVPPTPVYEAPPVASGYGAPATEARPVYDYAPGSTAKSVTVPQAPVPTMKWVTAPSNSKGEHH